MRLRRRLTQFFPSFLIFALGASAAEAAPQGGSPGPARSSSQFTLKRDEAGGADATTARQRARAGDCAAALPAFDAAIRVTIEPTLRRDRGLCHEKLQHPFPAIEDYRWYLTARPDAPDADQIRDRLARLEESVGIGGPSAEQMQERGEPGGAVSGSVSVSTSTGGRAAAKSEHLGPKAGEPERGYDYYAERERLAEAADDSPLRYGTGWSLAPYLQLPRYYFVGGTTSDFGFGVGASFRYSFSSTSTFLFEVGYVGFGTTGQVTASGGPQLFLGFEYRAPLDHWASNQLYFGIGPGYERYSVTVGDIATNVIAARARVGYRHVFGPQVGLEIGADGGGGVVILSGLPAGFPSASDGIGLISGSIALAIGF